MKELIKQQLRKSTWGLPAAYLAHDLLWRFRLSLGLIGTGSGTTHQSLNPAQSVEYIRAVFDDYKQYGDVDHFHGACAELGPGDSAGVALLLRSDGAESVDLVDRFASRRDGSQQRRIYAELARQCPATRVVIADDCDGSAIPGISWRTGNAAEEYFSAAARLGSGSGYDFIVSRSVLEHLYDPLNCLRSMVAALSPSGKMIHKVDLRDHGMFAGSGNPLRFLQIPTLIYRHMTQYSGRPNRILIGEYRRTLEDLRAEGKLQFKLLITQLVGVGEIVPHRPVEQVDPEKMRQAVAFVDRQRANFASEFRDTSSEDLAIQGMFIVVTR